MHAFICYWAWTITSGTPVDRGARRAVGSTGGNQRDSACTGSWQAGCRSQPGQLQVGNAVDRRTSVSCESSSPHIEIELERQFLGSTRPCAQVCKYSGDATCAVYTQENPYAYQMCKMPKCRDTKCTLPRRGRLISDALPPRSSLLSPSKRTRGSGRGAGRHCISVDMHASLLTRTC